MKKKPIRKFDFNIKIETERLFLRPFTLEDLDDFSLICADPEVMRFIGKGTPLDKMGMNHLKRTFFKDVWVDVFYVKSPLI